MARACAEYKGLYENAFLLMAQYDGLAVIPVEMVCRDYFRHLTVEKFFAKFWLAKSAFR